LEVLHAESVTVSRGRRTVLSGVELSVGAGSVVQLAGANGSGKTSLLRVLAGIAAPRGGRVRRVGTCAFVPEKVALTPALDAGQWLRVMRRLRRLAPTDWDAHAADSGLAADVLGQASARLSKGTLQRIALLEALHSGAGVLLLDEPFAGLDVDGRGWLTARLDAHLRAGGAVVATDHSGALRHALGLERAFLLADGRCRPWSPKQADVSVSLTAPDGTRLTRTWPAGADAVVETLRAEGWEPADGR
jgi:ABC-type multidrug transport system ATPase subunit